ncbi:unnamed protein product [Oikopleura dioica]|uniref:Zinc finger CCCH domain-containing protein 14 n=1 Tax=Oikopleura dioica TaxID=34765 RepID=E4XWX8_OIKDI|nr:unnamed protein product [Oikopleura dioica]
MQASAEISHKVRLAIKTKLTELGAYVDDELPDYVLVMVANRRGRQDMKKELELFLGDATDRFCTWLFGVLDRLKDAKKGRDLTDKKKSDKVEDKELDDFSEEEIEKKPKQKSPSPEPAPKKESKKSWKRRSPTPEKTVKSKKKDKAESPARNGMPSWSPQRKSKDKERSRSKSRSRDRRAKRRSRSRSVSSLKKSRSRSRERKEKKSKDKKSKKDRKKSRSRSRSSSRSKKNKKSDLRKELDEEERRSKARAKARVKGVKSSIVVKKEEVSEDRQKDKSAKGANPTSNLLIRAINESSGTKKKVLSGITRSITVSKPGESKVTIEKTGDKRRSKTKDEREPIKIVKKADSRVFITKNGEVEKTKRSSSPKFVVTLEGKKGSTAALKSKTKKKTEENEEALVIHPDESDDESSKLLNTSDLIDEAQKIKQLQKKTLPQEMSVTPIISTMDINASLDSSDTDKRTVFVSGLDVITTEPELKEHFQVCGTIVRVTILRDRFTRMSKGCAYIQFATLDQRQTADVFDNTEIHGKTIRVTQKVNRAELHSAPPTATDTAYHKPYKPHFQSTKPGNNPYTWTRSGYMPPR